MTAATRNEISEWFDKGVAKGATHMVVVCDTFGHDDYPVYVMPDQDPRKVERDYHDKDMQRVMEVYKLTDDKQKQLGPGFTFRY